jgi:hypothetical protein
VAAAARDPHRYPGARWVHGNFRWEEVRFGHLSHLSVYDSPDDIQTVVGWYRKRYIKVPDGRVYWVHMCEMWEARRHAWIVEWRTTIEACYQPNATAIIGITRSVGVR